MTNHIVIILYKKFDIVHGVELYTI